MIHADRARFNEMFDYHSAPLPPTESAETVVFGRHDKRLGETMLQLYSHGLADHFVISGNFGKDSGELWDQQLPESDFVGSSFLQLSHHHGMQISRGVLDYEHRALTGDDNARFSLQMLEEQGRSLDAITTVSHATSARRLASTLEVEAARLELDTSIVYRVPTNYDFDAENPADQQEAAAELLRLAYWPAKGWLTTQPDLPEDLVDFARSVVPEVPGRPSELSKSILRRTPLKIRRRLMHA